MTPRSAKEMRLNFLNSVQDVFAAKTCLTVIGFVLKAAMLCTIFQVPLSAETGSLKGQAHGFRQMVSAVAVYMVLVGCVVAMKYQMTRNLVALHGNSKARAETLRLYMGGLDMIPAWAFKDCVASAMVGHNWGMLVALVVLVTATCLALVLEPAAPPEDEQPDLTYSLRKTLSGCMGLGVGFAVNAVAQIWWRAEGGEWFRLPVQMVYAPVATLAVLLVHAALGTVNMADQKPFVKTLCNFMKVAGNFVAAWAWDGVLDTARLEVLEVHDVDSCLNKAGVNSLWALAVICVAAIIIVTHEWAMGPPPKEGKRPQGQLDRQALLAVVCGVNSAWAALDFEVGINGCATVVQNVVIQAWIFALAVVVLMALVLSMFTWAVEHLEGQDVAKEAK